MDKTNKNITDSSNLFDRYFKSNMAVMLIINPITKMIVDANPAAEKYYGWSHKQLLDMNIGQINTLSAEQIAAEMEKARTNRRSFFRFKHRKANGEIRPVEVFSTKIEVDGHEYLHSIVHDASEQEKAELELKHSHELMRYIIEHNSSAVAVHDRNMNYIYVSQSYLKQYEVSENDVIGKNHYEVFPDLPEKWRIVHQKALKGEVSSADDDLYIKDDGCEVWTRWECRPWYDSDGSIGGIVVYTEVINEHRQRELKINQLNHRLKSLITALQELTTSKTIEQVQNIVVHSARKLIGADGATLVFSDNNQCYYVAEDAMEPLWKGKRFPIDSCISGWVMQNKQVALIPDIYSDSRVPHTDYKSTFVKSLVMVPINVSEPIGAIGNYWKSNYKPDEIELGLLQTLADSAARAIESINVLNEIERKAVERTRRLEASFLANMSHEIRTPINSIMGFSSLLPDEESRDIMCNYADIIVRNSEHLVHIIDDIVMYSRLQAKMMAYQTMEFNICNLFHELKHIFAPQAQQKGLSLVFENEIECNNLIKTDYDKLKQVFVSLIANAIKYTEKGTIRVYAQKAHNHYIFSVSDTGIGIPKTEQDKIFERFFRGSNTRKETVPGTGLGLSIVKELIELLDGDVWVESNPDEKPGEKGSVFSFSINSRETK